MCLQFTRIRFVVGVLISAVCLMGILHFTGDSSETNTVSSVRRVAAFQELWEILSSIDVATGALPPTRIDKWKFSACLPEDDSSKPVGWRAYYLDWSVHTSGLNGSKDDTAVCERVRFAAERIFCVGNELLHSNFQAVHGTKSLRNLPDQFILAAFVVPQKNEYWFSVESSTLLEAIDRFSDNSDVYVLFGDGKVGTCRKRILLDGLRACFSDTDAAAIDVNQLQKNGLVILSESLR